MTEKKSHMPHLLERITSIIVVLSVLILIIYIVVRNEPFKDPNIALYVRIILSVLVGAVGAVIPGFLHVEYSFKGIVVRAGGALALAALTYIYTPTVFQEKFPQPPPLTSNEISTIHNQGVHYLSAIRDNPFIASIFKKDLNSLANKLWSDSRYESQAPHETALIYRLYAAALLFQRLDAVYGGPAGAIRDALPWLTKAIQLDDQYADLAELKEAENFYKSVAEGKVETVEIKIFHTHEFRVAMPGANEETIKARVEAFTASLIEAKQELENKLNQENFSYLCGYIVNDQTICQIIELKKKEYKERFPNAFVDITPIYALEPDGSTLVTYTFSNEDDPTTFINYTWRVNKAQNRVIPLGAAEGIMNMSISKNK